MFKKIIVVEDLDAVGYGITAMLQKELKVKEIVFTKYCDGAYQKIQAANFRNDPFDLLITDLSFQRDHRPFTISSGKSLIEKIRSKNHDLPIIICSVEAKSEFIKRVFKLNLVSAYVLKGRDGLQDLKNAVEAVYEGGRFLSAKIEKLALRKNLLEIEEYDVSLLTHLSNGLTQDQISNHLSNSGVSPCSVSTIEKKLNRLKDILQANNNVQLVSNAKDIGLI